LFLYVAHLNFFQTSCDHQLPIFLFSHIT
jgi:hypothetical protein